MVFTAEQLHLLKQAVDEYCRDAGIVDKDERQYVVELASALLDFGALELHHLRQGPEETFGPCQRPTSH